MFYKYPVSALFMIGHHIIILERKLGYGRCFSESLFGRAIKKFQFYGFKKLWNATNSSKKFYFINELEKLI